MGRPPRVDVGGCAYHVLNRSVGRRMMFHKARDFEAFEQVLAEAVARSDGAVELLAYCVMGNHWHLVLYTRADGALSPFMKWLTLTHTQRYRVAHGNVGEGPLYQGRFKSFMIEQDEHLLSVCRYVERNAARASLVARAEDWRWSSLWRWRHPEHVDGFDQPLVLSDWPTVGSALQGPGGRPRHWLRLVNTPLKEAELRALQISRDRGRPYGSEAWMQKQVKAMGLEATIRSPGRPKAAE